MTINMDDFLKDIDPNNVCGDDLRYDPEFIELEQAIKGKPEQQMGGTVIEAEPPNWRDIKKQSEALLSRTINLRILICYLRALIALDGFSGLQDGLTLIRTLVEKRWDSIHPQLDPEDDNDPTERINILLYLCDVDPKSTSENILWTLQQMPLVESKALGRFSFHEISIASGKTTATSKEKAVSQATIDAAVQDSELNQLRQRLQGIIISADNLEHLENILTEHVGAKNVPSFADLHNFLKDCKAFLIAALEKKGVGDNTEQELLTEDNALEGDVVTPSPTPKKSVLGFINNNQDVIQTLNLVCDYYRKNEPSSPVPLFIDRAVRLVGKSFIDAIKDIAPTGIDEAKIILGKQHNEDD